MVKLANGSSSAAGSATWGTSLAGQFCQAGIGQRTDVSPVAPTLSILTPLGGKRAYAPQVCLATGFFPKEGLMHLTLNSKENVSIPTTKAVLSTKSRSYYFAGFSKKSIELCRMNGASVKKTLTDVEEVITTSPPVTYYNCTEEPTAQNDTTVVYNVTTDYAKINFSSLLVIGLRVLFTKMVAFNMLLTVKALVF